MSLQNRKVVIIGGSAGIGLATAVAAAAAGAHVVVGARDARELSKMSSEARASIDFCKLDVRDVRGGDYCIDQIGPFDHLVYTAVEPHNAPFLEMEIEEAHKVFDVKFWGAMAAIQSAAPSILEGGSVTLFSGVSAHKPIRGLSLLAAANGAIEALVRSLAVELSPIRVNAVSPGLVDTHGMRDEQREALASTLPTRRVGTAADVAQAALFAMQNTFMTGTVIHVDGGDKLV